MYMLCEHVNILEKLFYTNLLPLYCLSYRAMCCVRPRLLLNLRSQMSQSVMHPFACFFRFLDRISFPQFGHGFLQPGLCILLWWSDKSLTLLSHTLHFSLAAPEWFLIMCLLKLLLSLDPNEHSWHLNILAPA